MNEMQCMPIDAASGKAWADGQRAPDDEVETITVITSFRGSVVHVAVRPVDPVLACVEELSGYGIEVSGLGWVLM